MWPGIGEAVKRLGVARLDEGKVLVMAGGESAYTLQPRERGREVRDMPRLKKEEGRTVQWRLSPGAAVRRPNSTRGSRSGA
jgi:hypothetical protein